MNESSHPFFIATLLISLYTQRCIKKSITLLKIQVHFQKYPLVFFQPIHYFLYEMKRIRITLICISVLTLSLASLFSEAISAEAQKEIDGFMTLRMNLASCASPETALSEIEAYAAEHFSENALASFTDEEKLIFENFKILEQYNYMRQIPSMEGSLKSLIRTQYDKNDAYFSAHKNGAINKWLWSTAADMLSCNLSYATVGVIMRDGIAVKKYYEKALNEDPAMSYALTNIAQWYYFAPSIGGGSKTKAGEYFERAVRDARTDAETYFAKIFLSQFLFDDKTQKAESAKLLDEADSLQKGGSYIAWIKKVNKAGYSLLEYNAKKMTPDNIEKKLAKQNKSL
ncbi:hypothetical protein HMPREF1221_00603 [Treponema socranskii subsp. paredis ATCC 35535]|nr:hypothetical protein HMPREF1221_00603 [Treponema socranskii subsp. paredis ATCC 35535]